MTFMRQLGSLALRVLGGSARATRLAFALAASLASGCLVSFDGYQPLEGGAGNAAGDTAGTGSGGKASGGSKGNGGRAGGGAGSTSGGAGATDALGGDGGMPVGGSASVSGAGGKAGGSASGGSSAGTAGMSGSAGAGGTPAKNCPVNLVGPPLIEIPKTGGGFYCMDRTEVPNEDYAAFLAANPSAVGQSAECGWNDSYQPDTSAACATALGAYDPIVRPRVPVSCVDWCDAKRYCAWAGKRLCGAIAGGANPPGSYIDANASQWYRACSKAGAQKFPYGSGYQSTYCVGLDNSGTHPSPVASAPACQGGYAGLFDMSGNVAEWEDSCSANAGAGDNCLMRGGSIRSVESVAPSLLCNDSTFNDATPSAATAKRSTKAELIGLRCCYDP